MCPCRRFQPFGALEAGTSPHIWGVRVWPEELRFTGFSTPYACVDRFDAYVVECLIDFDLIEVAEYVC